MLWEKSLVKTGLFLRDSALVAHRFRGFGNDKMVFEIGRVGTKGSKNNLRIGSAESVCNKLTLAWKC